MQAGARHNDDKAGSSSSSDYADGGEEGESGAAGDVRTEAELSAEVKRLEQAFEAVAARLRGVDPEALGRLDPRQLLDWMERNARGDGNAPFPTPAPAAGPKTGGFQTNAILQRHPVNGAPAASASATEEFDVSKAADMLFSSDGGGGGGGGDSARDLGYESSGGGSESKSAAQKTSLAKEVKRISLEYNEEKQKLDLMMKIQQTRQRQALQRKLFEKNQRKNQQPGLGGAGAGGGGGGGGDLGFLAGGAGGGKGLGFGGEEYDYGKYGSGGVRDGGDDLHEHAGPSEYNSIEIGANRGLASLRSRQPSSLQPVFKGLPAEAYGSSGNPSVAAGSSSAKPQNQQHSMAARGLNLGPLMRK
jgi:hypothetical protein